MSIALAIAGAAVLLALGSLVISIYVWLRLQEIKENIRGLRANVQVAITTINGVKRQDMVEEMAELLRRMSLPQNRGRDESQANAGFELDGMDQSICNNATTSGAAQIHDQDVPLQETACF